MASKFPNELCCIKHCWDVCEQNSIVNSVRVDATTAEWAIIASNTPEFEIYLPFAFDFSSLCRNYRTCWLLYVCAETWTWWAESSSWRRTWGHHPDPGAQRRDPDPDPHTGVDTSANSSTSRWTASRSGTRQGRYRTCLTDDTVSSLLRLVYTERLRHHHRNKCYVDGQNGYATHSARHCAFQKDQRWRLSVLWWR